MKRILTLMLLTVFATFGAQADASLVLTGVIDGDLAGGNPKAIIVTATADIADLSTFGLGVANNGGGSDGQEFTFAPGTMASAGDIFIITGNTASTDFFETCLEDHDGIVIQNSVANINGNDAVELFSSGSVIDVYGDVAIDGTGEPWEYADGYAVRTDSTIDGTFVQSRWDTQLGFFDGSDLATHKDVIADVFGLQSAVPEPGSALLLGLGGLALVTRRRRS